jgi:hypothetical protein
LGILRWYRWAGTRGRSHPEYPSQAAANCGVVVGIMGSVFRPNPAIPFTATDSLNRNVKRQFDSIAHPGARKPAA